jgi:hypothetical protein
LPAIENYKKIDPKFVRAHLGNPSQRFKIINDKGYLRAGGAESEGFEGKANELMPIVWKSANVPLDSVYGFEAFITR